MPTSNRLLHESSPYLLQHAHNPVDWFPWGEEALAKAKRENKAILLSVGYSACHWCHVMERESFENEQITAYMNAHYVCIKVDREERPDIDQIYMEALQNLGIAGGWPMNVFLLPNGLPFYGGTYFPAREWSILLGQLQNAFQGFRQQLDLAGEGNKITLQKSELEHFGLKNVEFSDISLDDLTAMYHQFSQKFDRNDGGIGLPPKFPMPCIFSFLMNYYDISKNEDAKNHLIFSLNRMAIGGIYDQIGGGFSRYSVDKEWHVPHFEKMLYDNGQLLSTYAQAYALTEKELYKNTVYQTINFLERELLAPSGAFYAALDADSEGEEGKFYVWTTAEIEAELPPASAALCKLYYFAYPEGNWEDGKNVLRVLQTHKDFANHNNLTVEALQKEIALWQKTLLTARSKRIRPNLDNKIIASWNGLALKGLVDAYTVFREERFLSLALNTANLIEKNLLYYPKNDAGEVTKEQIALWRIRNEGKNTFMGFLDDYAAVIQAFTALYQACFDEKWLSLADYLMRYATDNFLDETESMFFYTDSRAEALIARKKEIFDNVIPASNSLMAQNLHTLGLLLDNDEYIQLADAMLATVVPLLKKEVRYLANWGALYACRLKPTVEVAITGEDYKKLAAEVQQVFFPNKVMCAADYESGLPLLQNRFSSDGKSRVFVCRQKTCLLPVENAKDALDLMKK